jgi:hypothetical protein
MLDVHLHRRMAQALHAEQTEAMQLKNGSALDNSQSQYIEYDFEHHSGYNIARGGGQGGNVGRIFESSVNNADVKLEGAGGHNYIFKGSVKNSHIRIKGVGGSNYIFQGAVTNSDIWVESSGASNVIFQGSVNNSDVRIEGAGDSLCIFQRSVNNSSIKDRGHLADSRFIFIGSTANTKVSYRQVSRQERQ